MSGAPGRPRSPSIRPAPESREARPINAPLATPVSSGIVGSRSNLQMRAMVIRVSTRIVKSVLGHELNHLQDALFAVDVRERYIRLKDLHPIGRPLRMHEQAIREHGNLRRVLNDSRLRPRPPVAISRGSFRIRRQLGGRVHRQRYPIVPRVVNGPPEA